MIIDSGKPLFDSLKRHIDQKHLPFHTPGHKGGNLLPYEFVESLIEFDLTELPDLDNLLNPCGVIRDAQGMAARAFNADYTFFLVNGSTAGILAMIAGALKKGDKLLLPRNCHRSVLSALSVCDIRPVYIQNNYSAEHSFVLPITPEQMILALDANPDVRGVLLVNPDYYGVCGHLKEIAEIVHRYGKILLVDEAHGAHFPFHPSLPVSASFVNADAWVHSAHKTLPALTQSGYLHLKGSRIDPMRVLKMLSIFQTSSPSYLLMASLDWARWYMEEFGHTSLEKVISESNEVRFYLEKKWDTKTIEDYGLTKEICTVDPTRLCIDVSSRSINGYEALENLRKIKVEPEMSDQQRVVFICTVADDLNKIKTLREKFDSIMEFSEVRKVQSTFASYGTLPQQIMSPRETFSCIMENLPLISSEGRICAQAIGAFPPGIARFCPGELIDRGGIGELLEIRRLGGHLFGVSSEGMVSVVK